MCSVPSSRRTINFAIGWHRPMHLALCPLVAQWRKAHRLTTPWGTRPVTTPTCTSRTRLQAQKQVSTPRLLFPVILYVWTSGINHWYFQDKLWYDKYCLGTIWMVKPRSNFLSKQLLVLNILVSFKSLNWFSMFSFQIQLEISIRFVSSLKKILMPASRMGPIKFTQSLTMAWKTSLTEPPSSSERVFAVRQNMFPSNQPCSPESSGGTKTGLSNFTTRAMPTFSKRIPVGES